MAFPRPHLYHDRDRIASHFAKALSHPARLAILRKLTDEGPLTAGKLALMHPISKQAISQHLRILRNVDLVISWEKYPYTFYKINKKNLKKMKGCLEIFLNQI